jgi:putative transposase
MRYRRSQTPGATFFFTLVTYERKKMLCLGENPGLLRQAFEAVKNKHPFVVDAIVLLPDHLHCLWTLPPGDNEYSKRWMLIKSNFTRTCHDPFESRPRESSAAKREQYIWQRHFWEHQIRDDADFKHGIHTLQSGQARLNELAVELEIFQLPQICERGQISFRLGCNGYHRV